MLTALTRAVSPSIESCELTWLERQQIDVARAIAQHRIYEDSLRALGARVISLPEEPDLPDSVFVEDPLIVVDEIAVIAPMGCESRRAEAESLAKAIAPFRPVARLSGPAKLEGGDVMRVDRTLYVGLSSRTDAAGIAQLGAILKPFGYCVVPVAVHGCLHLKSACTSLGEGALLANRAWLDTGPLQSFRILDVAADEPHAANVLRIGDTVLMPAAFPQTEQMLRNEGFTVRTVDISELMKAEAAVTCSSVIFEVNE
jgi:dimethylargininase